MAEKRRSNDKEFKISEVKMILEEAISTAEVSRDLGVNKNTLYKWKREYMSDQQQAFPGKGRMKPEDEEISKLRKQVKRLEMERDILKKAIGYFTKHQE